MGKFSDLAAKIGREYSTGDIVFNQGDAADAMYLIYSGKVSVFRQGEVERSVLGKLGPGEIFGEMALVDKQPRSATVQVMEDSTLIPITAAFLMDNIHKDPRFIFQIIESLILRIEETASALKNRIAHGVTVLKSDPVEGADRSGIDMIKFLQLFRGYADPDKYLDFGESEVIFEEGDTGDLMFIILEGEIQIKAKAGEKTQVLACLERGDFFGESALLTDLPRSATASSLTNATVLPVVRKDLIDGLLSDADAAMQLVKMLILRLRGNLDLLTG